MGAALCLSKVAFFTRLAALQTHFCSLRKLIQGAIYSLTNFPIGPIFPDHLTIFVVRGGDYAVVRVVRVNCSCKFL